MKRIRCHTCLRVYACHNESCDTTRKCEQCGHRICPCESDMIVTNGRCRECDRIAGYMEYIQ